MMRHTQKSKKKGDIIVENETLVNVEEMPKKKKIMSRTKKRVAFYSIMLIAPLLHTLVFYFYLNFSSVLMGFQIYSKAAGSIGYDVRYSFENFIYVINYISDPTYTPLITNSVLFFIAQMAIGTTAALLFSYYIYKKFFLAEFFRVILFLPQIISSLVLVLLFRYIAEDVYTTLAQTRLGLISNPETTFLVVVIYNLWIGFGTNILLYAGAMSGIDNSIVESSHLDGVTTLQEFFYITFPMIFSTFTVFIITGLSTMFSQQLSLFTFFGSTAPNEIRTVGYFMTISTLQSSLLGKEGYWTYSQISAMGLIITIVTFPISFGVKKLMEKYGPSVN